MTDMNRLRQDGFYASNHLEQIVSKCIVRNEFRDRAVMTTSFVMLIFTVILSTDEFITPIYGQSPDNTQSRSYTYYIDPSPTSSSITDAVHKAFVSWQELNPSLTFTHLASDDADIIVSGIKSTDREYSNIECDYSKCKIIVLLGTTDCNGRYVHRSSDSITTEIMQDIGHLLGISNTDDKSHLMYGTNTKDTLNTLYTIPKPLDSAYYTEQEPILDDINALDEQRTQLQQKRKDLEQQYNKILAEYGVTLKDIKDSIYNYPSSMVHRLNPIQDKIDEINVQMNILDSKRSILVERAECFLNIRATNSTITVVPVDSEYSPITYYINSSIPVTNKTIPIVATHQAFAIWQSLNPTLTFIQIKHPDADIIVSWDRFVQDEHVGLAICEYAYCELLISLGNRDCTGSYIQLDTNSVSDTIMHEIGHALGLAHHSSESHLMYGSDEFTQISFDDMGYEIPPISSKYDHYIGQKANQDKIDRLDQRLELLNDEYNMLFQEYIDVLAKYGLTPEDIERDPSVDYRGLVAKSNPLVDKINNIVDEINPLVGEYNILIDKANCFPNVES